MPFSPRQTAPSPEVGYWRGSDWPEMGGAGPKVPVSTANVPYWNTPSVPGYGNGSFSTPTVGYLFVFTVIELFLLHHLSTFLKI